MRSSVGAVAPHAVESLPGRIGTRAICNESIMVYFPGTSNRRSNLAISELSIAIPEGQRERRLVGILGQGNIGTATTQHRVGSDSLANRGAGVRLSPPITFAQFPTEDSTMTRCLQTE